jgi:hypothetical protein
VLHVLQVLKVSLNFEIVIELADEISWIQLYVINEVDVEMLNYFFFQFTQIFSIKSQSKGKKYY